MKSLTLINLGKENIEVKPNWAQKRCKQYDQTNNAKQK